MIYKTDSRLCSLNLIHLDEIKKERNIITVPEYFEKYFSWFLECFMILHEESENGIIVFVAALKIKLNYIKPVVC